MPQFFVDSPGANQYGNSKLSTGNYRIWFSDWLDFSRVSSYLINQTTSPCFVLVNRATSKFLSARKCLRPRPLVVIYCQKLIRFQLQTDFFIQCMTRVGVRKDVISGFARAWQYNQKLGKLYVTKIENPEFVLRTGNEWNFSHNIDTQRPWNEWRKT